MRRDGFVPVNVVASHCVVNLASNAMDKIVSAGYAERCSGCSVLNSRRRVMDNFAHVVVPLLHSVASPDPSRATGRTMPVKHVERCSMYNRVGDNVAMDVSVHSLVPMRQSAVNRDPGRVHDKSIRVSNVESRCTWVLIHARTAMVVSAHVLVLLKHERQANFLPKAKELASSSNVLNVALKCGPFRLSLSGKNTVVGHVQRRRGTTLALDP